MEAVCAGAGLRCEVRALAAALHALHLYCATIAAALITCCAPPLPSQKYGKRTWRAQNTRGVATLLLGVVWGSGAAASLLRPGELVALVSAWLAPAAWLSAAWLHVALWTRYNAAPVLYLALYWLLTAVISGATLWQILQDFSFMHFDVYFQFLTFTISTLLACIDALCFYDEVIKRFSKHHKTSPEVPSYVSYEHNNVHFYSKITFFWLNPLLYKGYCTPLEYEDLGDLPSDEKSSIHYQKFIKIFNYQKNAEENKNNINLYQCYIRMIWPNFYVAGIFKLFGDMLAVVPPLGLAIIVQFIEGHDHETDLESPVLLSEFLSNGYIMTFLVTIALFGQALLSQNSTHLVTVEGIRLKTALQGLIYDKCMRLAPWTPRLIDDPDEESPLLRTSDTSDQTKSGLLTNLLTQDTYNIMSCVWICHYTWAIPLKVSVLLYLLYTKLGASALIGSATSILVITPLHFYIGKKISDNSKEISKCTDHRISKMTEILQGINVIKLYVWEDLFMEKILNLREVELKLLNKDSVYWNFLTFSTQISTILVTMVTFLAFYFIGDRKDLTAMNVFASLALFNQLSIPLLILPVTVLMLVQAMVSTKRIQDFICLAESNNIDEEEIKLQTETKDDSENEQKSNSDEDHFSEEEGCCDRTSEEPLIKFENAIFSWGMRNDCSLLEIDDLNIPAGKLIMVVGPAGSGKSSLLSAVLGEMYLERGHCTWNGQRSMWYAGQPPWLVEGSVRENVVMGATWCHRRYARVLRATALRPDLQLLPDGDTTVLGARGAPLSGGQRVRVCIARALYSLSRLIVLDEPLAALDAPLAQHVLARGLVPAARAGRTVLLATNRIELMHYADLIIVMEQGRVVGMGGADKKAGAVSRWWTLAAEARAARGGSARGGCGVERERVRLRRATTHIATSRRNRHDESSVGITEVTGAHLMAEVGVCGRGSWRRCVTRHRPALARQLSSPPPTMQRSRYCRDVRRAVSADATSPAAVLRREPSLMRRLLRPRPSRSLARWTPRPLRRLLITDLETGEDHHVTTDQNKGDISMLETAYTSAVTSNGGGSDVCPVSTDDSVSETEQYRHVDDEWSVWWNYCVSCGWWGAAYVTLAATAQALCVTADYWLSRLTATNAHHPVDHQQLWCVVRAVWSWAGASAAVGGLAGAAAAAGGARARRTLHDRLVRATLASDHLHHSQTLHRFSADIPLIDRKMPIALTRWLQLVLLCGAAMVVNVAVQPWSLLGLLPALIVYFLIQNVYLRNARELHRCDARSASSIVSLANEAAAGGASVRAGRLQRRLRDQFLSRLDRSHNALLMLNASNRWLGLSLDVAGSGAVCAALCGAVWAERGGGGAAGLAGAQALLLPLYLAHLAKCRADLDLHLAAAHRVLQDSAVTLEHYRQNCPIPSNWQKNGDIQFENAQIQYELTGHPILTDINLSIKAGEKVAICGRSGSGKSTLVASLVGGARVSRGVVRVDGADVSRVPLRALRHRLVVVPQEPVLFAGTLRENIDPLNVHTDQHIWNTLRIVGLYDYVAAQPAGLECGVSGWCGSRAARAGVARGAVRAAGGAALLLDEPGAALDAAGDAALLAALTLAYPHTTLIVVTHRVSSVRSYGRVVVMEGGRVAEDGDPHALAAQPASRLARIMAAAHRPLH